jgi:hypothetical protein
MRSRRAPEEHIIRLGRALPECVPSTRPQQRAYIPPNWPAPKH